MANAPDLAKLRIDRDAPPPAVQRALARALWLGAAALALGAGIVLWARRGAIVPVQVVTASVGEGASGGGSGARGGGTVGIVANGYVVARTAGGLLALPINGIVTSTTNWNSFSEVAFAFQVTPGLLLGGLMFSVVMGVVGGFFPAWRASRLQVVQALR
jgi:ABC-type antimicrobial peptide transport system permease subunit